MRNWWKNPYLIGTTAYWLLRGISKTLHIQVQKDIDIDAHRPYIFAFWHGKQLLPSFILPQHHFTSLCALVSPSRDGEIVAIYLAKCGFDLVRGSSRANNAAALINLKRKFAAGASIGSGLDGPIGPIHVVKPGFIYLAQKYNIPVIPMGIAYSKAWIFNKAWDKFELPKPFSKAGLVLGKPYTVPQDIHVEQACEIVAQLIQGCEQEALELIS